jgi:rSAM/selenodomain-associated transferase 1
MIVLAKPPLPGRVKTRLVPPLTPEEASRFAGAFLQDLLRTLQQIAERMPARVTVALPEGARGESLEGLIPEGVALVGQGAGGLGRRLARVARESAARGAAPIALVGGDHPDLPGELLGAMIRESGRERVGWIPTEDGGFAAIALPRPVAGLFRAVPWSTPEVARAIRRNARASGVDLVEAGVWHDVDNADDLRRIDSEPLSAERCPATWRLLRTLNPALSKRGEPRGGGKG